MLVIRVLAVSVLCLLAVSAVSAGGEEQHERRGESRESCRSGESGERCEGLGELVDREAFIDKRAFNLQCPPGVTVFPCPIDPCKEVGRECREGCVSSVCGQCGAYCKCEGDNPQRECGSKECLDAKCFFSTAPCPEWWKEGMSGCMFRRRAGAGGRKQHHDTYGGVEERLGVCTANVEVCNCDEDCNCDSGRGGKKGGKSRSCREEERNFGARVCSKSVGQCIPKGFCIEDEDCDFLENDCRKHKCGGGEKAEAKCNSKQKCEIKCVAKKMQMGGGGIGGHQGGH